MSKFIEAIKKDDAAQMVARQIATRTDAVRRKNKYILNDREILWILNEQKTDTDSDLFALIKRIAFHLQDYQDVLPIMLPGGEDTQDENDPPVFSESEEDFPP